MATLKNGLSFWSEGVKRKALSVRQPFAWALFHGKDVEDRTWPLPPGIIGQTILIHASSFKKWSWSELTNEQFTQVTSEGWSRVAIYPMGALIGAGRFTGCLPKSASGLWKVKGQYGFQWKPEIEFKTPIPYRGQLKFFDVPDDIVKVIEWRDG